MGKENKISLMAKIIGWTGLILGILLVAGTLILLAKEKFHCFDANCQFFAIAYLVIAIGLFLVIFNSLLLKGKRWAGFIIAYILLSMGIVMFLLGVVIAHELEPVFTSIWIIALILGICLFMSLRKKDVKEAFTK